MVDMYFYRDPEEQERDAEEALEERKAVTAGAADDEFTAAAGDWDAEPAAVATTGGDWDATGGEWAATGGEAWDATAA